MSDRLRRDQLHGNEMTEAEQYIRKEYRKGWEL